MQKNLSFDRTPIYKNFSRVCWNRPPINLDQYTLPAYLSLIDIDNSYYIDIGARDDSIIPKECIDSASCCIFFECDKTKFDFYKNKTNDKFFLITEKVNRDNIVNLLLEKNPSKTPRLLSIDIDGYDYFILEKLFESGFRPSLIVAECNERIPPPIKFCINYDANYYWDSSNFYGCSIAKYEELFLKYDYELIEYTYGNLYAVKKDKNEKFLPKTAMELYDLFYRNDPFRSHQFWYSQQFEKWLHYPTDQVIEMINEYFKDKQGKFTIS